MFKLGATGFIKYQNKILLLKRSANEKLLPNFFEMPGGKIKFGETAEQALVREIKEETNLTVKVLVLYNVFNYLSADQKTQTFDLQFICRLKTIKGLKLSSEHESYLWISPKDINKLKISPEMRQAILNGFKFRHCEKRSR
ncbi:MAG: NUDIX domain-containing protein [Candidatus Uhrbacteria bacterium]